MKLPFIFLVFATILAAGNCTICYQCVEGEKNNELAAYKSCNRFLENQTCNTTGFSHSCVTYISDYLHKRTVVHDCFKDNRPIKNGPVEMNICSSNYCNYDEKWGHYNEASSVTLQTSLGFILIASLHFL